MIWYKDEDIQRLSEAHDQAIEENDENNLNSLINESSEIAENKANHPMIRASCHYYIATSLAYILSFKPIEGTEREKIIEKILYHDRESINIQDKYAEENENLSKEEKGYYLAVYNSAVVNYSNILSSLGRIPAAINSIIKSAEFGFGMALGNLGNYLKHYADLDYDTGHKVNHYIDQVKCMVVAIESNDPNIYVGAKDSFLKKIESTLSLLEGVYSFEEIYSNLFPLFKREEKLDWNNLTIKKDARYLNWKVTKGLSLNTLNDFDKTNSRGNEPLHLPNMIRPSEETKPLYHGLFNQIKQEYSSARYLLFDGIYNKSQHFSDVDVYLVDTLDYPVYSLNIEKIKSSYRAVYSIFDRIAYFLNRYLDIGLKENKIDFNRIWTEDKMIDLMNENHVLRGLYWIKKDLYNKTKSGYRGTINPKLNKAYQIRNVMEHRYLKIIDENFININEADDELASMIVSQQEFEELAVELLIIVREAIISLTQVVYIEERKKTNDSGITVSLDEFSDDWKV